VGTRILGGIRFQVYAGDHPGAGTPHVHARFPDGNVIIEIYSDNSVGPSSAHKKPIDPGVKKPQVKRALRVAAVNVEALLKLWEESRMK
jgi:hypothetical protein